mmetsp:Transcript_13501/g.29224  ORF Transcript_13501/g.29224 Transcript_13501/m.29224 type:complete len:83 (-) Transcript_13501:101-349(-)
MLQQFKRAIGVAIVRGQAEHKMARMHYSRATTAEAVSAARAHHIDNQWRPGQNSTTSWYSKHTAAGYGDFEQFRNGYHFFVH